MAWQKMVDTGEDIEDAYGGDREPRRLWRNDTYYAVVAITYREIVHEGRAMTCRYWHLSLARHDRGINLPWRDKQRIKNDICGPETEGVELFPAESRLVDTSNQFHLWVFETRVAVGFPFRCVTEGTPKFMPLQVQEPWGDDKPSDCIDLSACRTMQDMRDLCPALFASKDDLDMA